MDGWTNYLSMKLFFSLQKQLAALADAAPGSHIHYDEHNSLEEGSAELIISRE